MNEGPLLGAFLHVHNEKPTFQPVAYQSLPFIWWSWLRLSLVINQLVANLSVIFYCWTPWIMTDAVCVLLRTNETADIYFNFYYFIGSAFLRRLNCFFCSSVVSIRVTFSICLSLCVCDLNIHIYVYLWYYIWYSKWRAPLCVCRKILILLTNYQQRNHKTKIIS